MPLPVAVRRLQIRKEDANSGGQTRRPSILRPNESILETEARGSYECEILQVENLIGAIYRMRLACPEIASHAQPGQFVNVKVNNEFIPLLRKPFSVSRRSVAEGWFEIVWKIVGKGTQLLSEMNRPQRISVLGPLGKGFFLKEQTDLAIVVAGGLGVAPFPFLCEELLQDGPPVEVFLGARHKDDLSLVDCFESLGLPATLTTEDGSAGQCGLVTDPVIQRLGACTENSCVQIYGCGPTAFLNAIMRISQEFAVDAQISLETMMGCGFGICVGCPVRRSSPQPSQNLYQLTCIDGPVFDSKEILLDA